MHKQNTLLGLTAALGIGVTAGAALPLVNAIPQLTVAQILGLRGFLTAIMAGLVAAVVCPKEILTRDRFTWLIMATVPLASLGLFMGVREWGATPTIIIIAASPLVNFLATVIGGRRVPLAAVLSFILLLSGVTIAQWEGRFSPTGFGWSIFGAFWNGLLYEWFARAKPHPLVKCLWGSVGIGTIGALLSLGANWQPLWQDRRLQGLVLIVVFVGGFIYWIANVVAFEHLPKDVAAVLAQVEVVAVIIGDIIIHQKYLSLIQWSGVVVALLGAGYLSLWCKEGEAKHGTETVGSG